MLQVVGRRVELWSTQITIGITMTTTDDQTVDEPRARCARPGSASTRFELGEVVAGREAHGGRPGGTHCGSPTHWCPSQYRWVPIGSPAA